MSLFPDILTRMVLAAAIAILPSAMCLCDHAAAAPFAESAQAEHACCEATPEEPNSSSVPEPEDCPHCDQTLLLATGCGDAAPEVVKVHDSSSWPTMTPLHAQAFTWMPKPEIPSALERSFAPPPNRSGTTLRAQRCLSLT